MLQLPHDTTVTVNPAIQRKQLLRDQFTAVLHQPSPLPLVVPDSALMEFKSQKGQYTHQIIHGDLLCRVSQRCGL